jgi:hypothetical protein
VIAWFGICTFYNLGRFFYLLFDICSGEDQAIHVLMPTEIEQEENTELKLDQSIL